MPTRVLLLCADEKAFDAVSQVLDELEISFEHFSDASLAVKRLSSQLYDAVVIDCDDEKSAAQIFNTLRSSSTNQGAITIAIVDGKGGLPNAFRLGASLVLTKPVSLEQARGTIRNAIAMRRKTAPESKAMAATAAQGIITVDAMASSAPAPSRIVEHTTPAAPAIPVPTTKIAPAQPQVAPTPQASAAAAKAAAAEPASAPTTPKRPLLSKAQSASQLTEHLTAPKAAPKARALESEAALSHDQVSHASPSAPTFGMLEKRESRKTSSGLLAVVALLLLGGSLYAAWTMVPDFSTAVLSQYNSLYARIAGATPPSQAAAPAPVQPRPAVKPPVPLTNAAASNQNAAGQNPSTSTPATSPVPDGFAPAPPAPAEGFASDAAAKQTSTTSTNSTSTGTSENDTPVEVEEEAADAHVAYRVRPVYPEAARRKLAKGEVVVLTVVNKDGTVGSAKVESGNPVFERAAIAAVKQWRYETYYQHGQPASFQTRVTLKFVPPARR
jgi:TonB family protein